MGIDRAFSEVQKFAHYSILLIKSFAIGMNYKKGNHMIDQS